MKEKPQELTIDEIIAINPSLKQWFSQHNRADLDGDKRLPTAEEKIELLGGKEQIKNGYKQAQKLKFGNEYLILSACYRNPMKMYEIGKFCRKSVGKSLSAITIADRLIFLIENNFIVRKDSLRSVTLTQRNTFCIVNCRGFLTTDEGFRKRVEVLEHREKGNLLGQVAPQPQ